MIPAHTVIYATTATDDGISDARGWVKYQGLGSDDCRIVKRNIEGIEICAVISKRDLSGLKLMC